VRGKCYGIPSGGLHRSSCESYQRFAAQFKGLLSLFRYRLVTRYGPQVPLERIQLSECVGNQGVIGDVFSANARPGGENMLFRLTINKLSGARLC
jgi:hypothetical protein